jgi:hypothetical protein
MCFATTLVSCDEANEDEATTEESDESEDSSNPKSGEPSSGNNSNPMVDPPPPLDDGDQSLEEIDPEDPSVVIAENFDGAELSNHFVVLHEDATSGITTTNGRLSVPVTLQGSWWQDQNESFFTYQLVDEENFMVTTRVHSRKASDTSQYIDNGYHYAGPMIRLPSSDPTGPQNFAFVAVGYQGSCDGGDTYCIETKSTTEDVPEIGRAATTGADAQLRLCKVGGIINVYSRNVNGTGSWTLRDNWLRLDLTGSLQVGLMAFSFTVGADNLHAQFDDMIVRRISSASDCLEE